MYMYMRGSRNFFRGERGGGGYQGISMFAEEGGGGPCPILVTLLCKYKKLEFSKGQGVQPPADPQPL